VAEAFLLGPWQVRPQLCELRRDDEAQRLTHKGMAVLCRLAEAAGGVVSKEALVEAVWEGAYTSDEALSAVIYELRRALDDDARRPRFIETIRKSGYRLVAPVTWEEPPHPIPETTDRPLSQTASPRPGRRRWLAAAVTMVAFLSAVLWITREVNVGEAREIRAVAVLPLTQIGTPENADALADGLTAMLTADIAQVCPFDVVPGLSMRLDDDRGNVWQVAEEMAVDAVLEGTVVHSGNRLWLSVQLVDTESGRLLWGSSFEREVGDTLATLRELAQEIAIQVNLTVADEATEIPNLP
jgi:DNA-binding winged helix-turn-helix (wHTH) protein/TolB-like protein